MRIIRVQSNLKILLGLSSIEFWERFSFYTLSYLLPFYMVDKIINGGMGFSETRALFWVGIYGFCAWSSPVLGGIIIDRYLGLFNSILFGGMLIICGHLTLFFINVNNFLMLFLGLLLICIGTGLFKPSITGLVGQVYDNSPFYRERAYSFYYSIINLGILLSGMINGLVVAKLGYKWGFSIAGIGMIVAMFWIIVQFSAFREKIYFIDKVNKRETILKSHKNKSFISKIVLLFSYLCSWLWACGYFLGIGGFIMFLIKQYTNRSIGFFKIPIFWFPSLSPLLLILFTFMLNFIWKRLDNIYMEPSTFRKLAFGQLICGINLGILVILLLSIKNISPNAHILKLDFFIIFYIIGVIGEILTCPISYSLISSVSKTKNIGLNQAVCFACYGLGSITAGSIASLFYLNYSINWIVFFMICSFITAFSMIYIEKKLNLQN